MFVCTDRQLLGFTCVLIIFIVCVSGDYGSIDTRSESLSENGGERTPQGSNECIGNNCVKRTVNTSPTAMWFGPRLGRRRRSGQKPVLNSKEIEMIADALNSPWTLASPTGEKRQPTQFTPRLGRELAEELLFGEFEDFPNEMESQDLYEEERSRPYFVSRFNRAIIPPPRPGRQLRQILAKF